MRESNHAFPAQNRACICITSQLYDRRALDTNSSFPLFNSLTHLTYLTSTSPRIREILTCDGGLERLVRLLRDFCICPPPPENPAAVYGLSPPSLSRPGPIPTLNPKSFDRHAAYRFSLAFQCVVNIGVRGSEPIRSRVVQAGTLDVVGMVLEAWLASKGFAVGPSASASGLPRETKEQRAQRRQQLAEQQRQREQALDLARLLTWERRQAYAETNREDEEMADASAVAVSDAETSNSTDNSANATPVSSGTPTGVVVVPGRDRSGTVIARPFWDPVAQEHRGHIRTRVSRGRQPHPGQGPSTSPSTSRAETETEDDQDADGDIEMSQEGETSVSPPPRPRGRRAVGIVSDSPPTHAGATSDSLDADLDPHVIISTANGEDSMGGVEEGIVALDQNVNDDLAMGAPPGAPGAIDTTPRMRTNTLTLPRDGRGGTSREELTPRAVLASLPIHTPMPIAMPVAVAQGVNLPPGFRNMLAAAAAADGRRPSPNQPQWAGRPTQQQGGLNNNNTANAQALLAEAMVRQAQHHRHVHAHHHHHGDGDTGPFREEDVLLSLQLLAYLSKYPHVRETFYKQRVSFHPATAHLQNPGESAESGNGSSWASSTPTATTMSTNNPFASLVRGAAVNDPPRKEMGFFKSLTSRGKEKEKATSPFSASSTTNANASSSSSSTSSSPTFNSNPTNNTNQNQPPQRMTNVFSLVERFTFRPSPAESALPSPPPFLPPEIQYWASVIMRNACRKDESRGGIRQCANMLCGKWETVPREFAKCRRCRKAKYCGKECQSRAWSEGHRFWCSAREDEVEGNTTTQTQQSQNDGDGSSGHGGDDRGEGGSGHVPASSNHTAGSSSVGSNPVGMTAATAARVERRIGRERERQRLAATAAGAPELGPNIIASAIARASAANAHNDGQISRSITTTGDNINAAGTMNPRFTAAYVRARMQQQGRVQGQGGPVMDVLSQGSPRYRTSAGPSPAVLASMAQAQIREAQAQGGSGLNLTGSALAGAGAGNTGRNAGSSRGAGGMSGVEFDPVLPSLSRQASSRDTSSSSSSVIPISQSEQGPSVLYVSDGMRTITRERSVGGRSRGDYGVGVVVDDAIREADMSIG